VFDYLYTDAVLGAGSANETWKNTEDADFRYGVGAVSLKSGARAKWNVEGNKFELWAPTGPDYGQGAVVIDGVEQPTINFHTDTPKPSRLIWASTDMPQGPHAIALIAKNSAIPLDSLSAITQAK
jgi:hypothetical protein